MADNTTLNPGSLGDTIATEDIGGVKYEKVKLIDSTVGSTSPTGVTANPLKVSVSTAIAAGDNNIGNVDLASSIPAGSNLIGKIEITDGAGIVNTKQLGTQLTTADVGLIANSTIHGQTTGGGGGFVDVKVTPSGALNVAATQDGTWSNVGVITGSLSTANSSTATLSAGATWTGTGESVVGYASVTCAVITDQAGTLYLEFSPDNTNWDSSLSYSVAAGTNEVHRLSVTRRYFRARFTNTSGSAQTYFRLQCLLGTQSPLTAALNTTVQTDSDSIITRSVLMGQTDDGNFRFVPVDAVGHLEVTLASPKLPFGSIHTENMTPIFQTDAVYGINSGQVLPTTSGSGSATASNGMFVCSTGTTVGSQAVIQSRKRLRYRPGQGFIARFTAIYSTPVANSYQLAGIGHSEDGAYFGYGNTSDLTDTRFGILYVHHGVRETRTLTVTTGATSAANCTITLNGTAYTVALTAASNIQRTVWEISQATYSGWDAYPAGATVVFVRKSAGVANGTYSFSAGTTGATATIAQTKAGVASTDVFIPQAEWNGDKLDGTGASGVTIDPTKGNVFQIDSQYLGFGVTVFKAEVTTSNGNTQFVVVHTIRNPNTVTQPIFGNPSFPFTLAVYSAGSTTNLTLKNASFAGFIEGGKRLHGNRFTYVNSLTTVGATNFQALFTILNTKYYAGRTNQAVINLLSIAGALKHTSPCIFYLIKNGSLVGNPNFQSLSSNSCSLWDTAATTVTYSTGDQLMWTGHLGDTGELNDTLPLDNEEITIQPGEWFTLAARAVTGSPSYVTGSINTREDQ